MSEEPINITNLDLDTYSIDLFNDLIQLFTKFINDKIINEPLLHRLISLNPSSKTELDDFLKANSNFNEWEKNNTEKISMKEFIDDLFRFFQIDTNIPVITIEPNKYINCDISGAKCKQTTHVYEAIKDMYKFIDYFNNKNIKKENIYLRYIIKTYVNLINNKLPELHELLKKITILNNVTNSERYNILYNQLNSYNLNVITYLKINNFDDRTPDYNDYNKRFRISLNSNNTSIQKTSGLLSNPTLLQVDYNEQDLQWYDENGNVSTKFINFNKPFYIRDTLIECKGDLYCFELDSSKQEDIKNLIQRLRAYSNYYLKKLVNNGKMESTRKDYLTNKMNVYIEYLDSNTTNKREDFLNGLKKLIYQKGEEKLKKDKSIIVNYKLKDTLENKKYILDTINNYSISYYYGYFSNIFTPKIQNTEIGGKMTEFIKLLEKNKMGFLLGYGASGSGKTSSLIYFNKGKTPEESNGTLIYLCNYFGNNGYVSLDVHIKQFYHCKDCSSNNFQFPNEKKSPPDSDKYTFQYSNGQWITTNKFPGIEFHYRIENKDNSGNLYLTHDPEDKSLGNFLVYLIDQDRYVKSTTNNPQSSRSHALCFITLKKNEGDEIKLVVGDLAGVENKFTDDIYNIEKIMNIKRDGTNTNYYDTECYEGKFDVIQGGTIDNDVLDSDSDSDSESISKYQEGGAYCDGKNQPKINIDNLKKSDAVTRTLFEILFQINEDNYTNSYFYNKINGLSENNIQNINNYLTSFNIKDFEYETYSAKGVFNETKLKDANYYFGKTSLNKNKIINDKEEYIFLKGEKIPIIQPTITKIVMTLTYIYDLTDIIDNNEKLGYNFTEKIIPVFKPNSDNYFLPSSTNNDKLPFIIPKKYKSLIHFAYIVSNMIDKSMEQNFDNLFKTIYEILSKKNIKAILDINIDEKKINEFIENILSVKKDFDSAKGIIQRRNVEGEYINDSLLKMKRGLEYIFSVKNKESIINSPNIMPVFYNTYCPTKYRCFQSPSVTSNKIIVESNIIREVYEFLMSDHFDNNNIKDDKKRDSELQSKQDKINDFCQKIAICIFGVLNISKRANNPPPVPYIDISPLKLHYLNNGNDLNAIFKTTIKRIKAIFMKYVPSKLNTDIEKKVKDCIEKMESNKDYVFEKNYIQEFMEIIEVFNNASAIGTLEFMDKMTKLNQTDIVAFKYNKENNKFGNPFIDENKLKNFLNMNSFENIYKKSINNPNQKNKTEKNNNYGVEETRRKTQKLYRK